MQEALLRSMGIDAILPSTGFRAVNILVGLNTGSEYNKENRFVEYHVQKV